MKTGAGTALSAASRRRTLSIWNVPWMYGADGAYHGDTKAKAVIGLSRDGRWKREQEIRDSVPTQSFALEDYDGERNEVVTHIEEWEWRRGEKWCAWLGYLAPKKKRRSLMLNFRNEVGREKGSWKGGLMGTNNRHCAG